MRRDSITEAELHAYLDGELDIAQRLAVETYLASEPAAAQRFMEELRLRTTLLLLTGAGDEPPAAMREASARLAVRLSDEVARNPRRWMGRRIMQGLAAAALVGVVVLPGRDVMASRPSYVADAVDAYHTGLLRAKMDSQIEAPRFDAAEIQRSTSIRVPRLPTKWVVTDAQIFPSEEGPALQLMIRTPSDRKLSIFAIHAPSDAPAEPTTVRHDGASVAYWREGEMSYAVTGGEAPEALDLVAEDIASDQADAPSAAASTS